MSWFLPCVTSFLLLLNTLNLLFEGISYWMLLFFLPYVVFSIVLLTPVPIAVLFEAFRIHRSKQVVLDRIKEREALFACFACMDLTS